MADSDQNLDPGDVPAPGAEGDAAGEKDLGPGAVPEGGADPEPTAEAEPADEGDAADAADAPAPADTADAESVAEPADGWAVPEGEPVGDEDPESEEERLERVVSSYSRSAASRYNARALRPDPVVVAIVAAVAVIAVGALAFVGNSLRVRSELASQQQEEQAQVTTVEAAPEGPVDVTMVAAGDVLVQSRLLSATRTGTSSSGTRTYDFSSVLKHVSDDVSAADLALVAHVSSLGGQDFTGGAPYDTPHALVQAELNAGFDGVLKASPYALDEGYEGLHAEMAFWDANHSGVPVIGVADPEGTDGADLARKVYLYEKDGVKVAVLDYTASTEATVSPKTDSDYVSYLSEAKVRADVAQAQEAGADAIVACVDWCLQSPSEVTDDQREYADLFSELGVDAVVGYGTGVLQPVEVLTNDAGEKTVCFYSLGNFLSSSGNEHSFMGGLAKLTFHRAEDGSCQLSSAELDPVVTRRANDTNFAVYRVADATETVMGAGWDTWLTPSYMQRFLDGVMGEEADPDTGTYVIDLS